MVDKVGYDGKGRISQQEQVESSHKLWRDALSFKIVTLILDFVFIDAPFDRGTRLNVACFFWENTVSYNYLTTPTPAA